MEKLFYDIFDEMPRLGPGSDKATLKALSFIPDTNKEKEILDIGCGMGVQTFVLAKALRGKITAIDNYQPFLDKIESGVKKNNFTAGIKCVNMDMNNLDFKNSSFDLVWGEGSIYITGFKKGLQNIRPLLKENGFVVFSEMNYLKDCPPQAVVDFFKSDSPEMIPVEDNIRLINEMDYELVNYFPLEKEAHWDPYYKPLEKRLELFRKMYTGDANAKEIIDFIQFEIDLYKQYSEYYGYYFYIMKKK